MTNNLKLGRQLRDEGMARADRNLTFAEEAAAVIKRIAARQPTLFVDDVLKECSRRPDHFNAWGAVWSRAIKAGIIMPTRERRQTSDPKKHAHWYPVYKSLIWECN